jgi:hypothetical protein
MISRALLFLSLLAFLALPAAAQYRTESYDLVPGWTAIYLNVDPGMSSLDLILASSPDVSEVWQWRPNGLDPSLTPKALQTGADEWKVWRRGDLANSSFSIFSVNAAYLVKLNANASPQTLSIKGKVVAPRVQWRTDGSNLVGFPIKTGTTAKLNRYLGDAGIVDDNTEGYHYVGGNLSANNPIQSTIRLINARRGEAFWVRSKQFANFYGPVSVNVALDSGLNFGAADSLKQLVLRNNTDIEVTVTLTPTPSEMAPGTSEVPTAPALLTRSRDATSGLFVYSPLGNSMTVTIPANDATGISLSVDRSIMGGDPGDPFAGLLRITDGGDYSEIFLPVTAEKASLSGLWVGEARISRVQNQLQRFQRETDGTYSVDGDGKHIPIDSETGLNETAQDFKMRLIVHLDAAGQATILSRAFAGIISDDGEGNTLAGLTTDESLLDAGNLKTAVRLSSGHFPVGLVQSMTGALSPGAALTVTIPLGANHTSNPFLHTYHPDHDNKDARFENVLPAGIESHTVNRAITLTLNATAGPGEGPQWGTTLLSGTFSETVTGIHKQPIAATGIFAIGKVSDIAVLQTTP